MGTKTLLGLALLVFIIFLVTAFQMDVFREGKQQLTCVTGTCVKDAERCIPEQSKSLGDCAGEETDAVCIQSFENIPPNCEAERTSEESSDQEGDTQGDGDQQENVGSPDETLIEIRRGDSSQPVKAPRIGLAANTETTLKIWSRGNQRAVCQVTVLSQNMEETDVIEPSSKEDDCGNEYEDENQDAAEKVIEFTIDTSQLTEEDDLSLQVITRADDKRLASVQGDIVLTS